MNYKIIETTLETGLGPFPGDILTGVTLKTQNNLFRVNS